MRDIIDFLPAVQLLIRIAEVRIARSRAAACAPRRRISRNVIGRLIGQNGSYARPPRATISILAG
jgi:hypothetical protein